MRNLIVIPGACLAGALYLAADAAGCLQWLLRGAAESLADVLGRVR
jgi:hypothetical protein